MSFLVNLARSYLESRNFTVIAPESPQTVFIEGRTVEYYHKVPYADAKEAKSKIIECSHCRRPAVQVDGFHPYYKDYTLCKTHARIFSKTGAPVK